MAFVLPIPHLARTEAEPLLATIGNTPLLRLDKISSEFPGVEIFGKAEYFNPGGSVKDRAAGNMVLDGERSGKMNHSPVILDVNGGRVTHFVAAMGTSGTFMGNSRRLKRDVPGAQCISEQPSSGFHGLEGLK